MLTVKIILEAMKNAEKYTKNMVEDIKKEQGENSKEYQYHLGRLNELQCWINAIEMEIENSND